jgi:divalent metal cation (Fe/Co/Zn/Cd) transporter
MDLLSAFGAAIGAGIMLKLGFPVVDVAIGTGVAIAIMVVPVLYK